MFTDTLVSFHSIKECFNVFYSQPIFYVVSHQQGDVVWMFSVKIGKPSLLVEDSTDLLIATHITFYILCTYILHFLFLHLTFSM